MSLKIKNIALLLCLVAGPLQAEDFHLALYGQRDEVILRAGNSDVTTSIGRYGAVLTGVYSPRLDARLDIAQAHLSQTGNPATQGMGLAGQYVGVALRLWPLRSARLDGWVQGDYNTQYSSGVTTGQSVEINWYDTGVSAGLVAHFGVVDLHGGVRQSHLTGEEIASGTLNYTRDVHQRNANSSWVGADLYVDERGTIGVLVENGSHQGISVRFAHQF